MINSATFNQRGRVIGIEGLIGSGKTEFSKALLTALIEQGSPSQLFLEPDEKKGVNPYLADYYEDISRWSFTMQVHLLTLRYRIHQYAQWFAMTTGGSMVLDRTLPGDTAFARLQYKQGLMSQREYETYRALYQQMVSQTLLPNFCVHLRVDPQVSIQRINQRMSEQTGRKCETEISLAYLEALQVETQHMIDVLENQGVQVITLDWSQHREISPSDPAIQNVAQWILKSEVPDFFCDIHKRII